MILQKLNLWYIIEDNYKGKKCAYPNCLNCSALKDFLEIQSFINKICLFACVSNSIAHWQSLQFLFTDFILQYLFGVLGSWLYIFSLLSYYYYHCLCYYYYFWLNYYYFAGLEVNNHQLNAFNYYIIAVIIG